MYFEKKLKFPGYGPIIERKSEGGIQMKKWKVAALLIPFFALLAPAFTPAQAAPGGDGAPRHVYLILDVSGSMNQGGKFRNVKEYLEKDVFGKLLQTGDRFTLITFGDNAREEFSRVVESESSKKDMLERIGRIAADDDYTDIGGAMEKLAAVLENAGDSGARRMILFITDGKNTPPKGSPYYGKDLSLDERFRAVGEKIARGGWFLYVIGIGAETDAKKIADSVSGSVYAGTEGSMSGLAVETYVRKVDEAALAREKALRAEAEKAALEEARKRAEEGPWKAFVRRLAGRLGLSPGLVTGILAGLAGLLVLGVAFFFYRALRPVRVVISDNVMGKADTLDRRLAPWSGILLNSAKAVLPGIGDETRRVFRLERGLFGLRLRIEDEEAIADGSPYKRKGVHRLGKTIVELANGNRVRIAVRK